MDPVNLPAKFEVHSGYVKTWGRPWIRRSRSSKVVEFGTNRKRVCNFLLVRHSNLGPILHRFRYISVFCASGWPHPYSTLILGVFPLHQMDHVRDCPSRGLKLFGREIIFEVCQPMCSRYLNVADGRTDRRTTYRALRSIARQKLTENWQFNLPHHLALILAPSLSSLLVTLHIGLCSHRAYVFQA